MRLRIPLRFSLTLLFSALLLVGCHRGTPTATEPYLLGPQVTDDVPRYGLLEFSFRHNGAYRNQFLDVDLEAILTSPSGIQRRLIGFYYGEDLWKIRFRPDETGSWNYSYTFTGAGGFRRQGTGTFLCLPSDAEGLVRSNPSNHFRWIFADGKPFFPVGLQDCVHMKGHQLEDFAVDGEDRKHPGRKVSADEYFSLYGRAGFNLLRFSQKNCSYLLMDDLDHYRVTESLATDDLLSTARKHGFRVMFGFFGFHGKQQSDIRALNVLERAMNRAFDRPTEAIENPENRELLERKNASRNIVSLDGASTRTSGSC